MLRSSVTERLCVDLYSQQSSMFIDVQFSYLFFFFFFLLLLLLLPLGGAPQLIVG